MTANVSEAVIANTMSGVCEHQQSVESVVLFVTGSGLREKRLYYRYPPPWRHGGQDRDRSICGFAG